MADGKIETDYLVIGAGVTAMAFVDTLLDETDHRIVLVDHHDHPAGHWSDAYPFVRLHQPSAYYGVGSRELWQPTLANAAACGRRPEVAEWISRCRLDALGAAARGLDPADPLRQELRPEFGAAVAVAAPKILQLLTRPHRYAVSGTGD